MEPELEEAIRVMSEQIESTERQSFPFETEFVGGIFEITKVKDEEYCLQYYVKDYEYDQESTSIFYKTATNVGELLLNIYNITKNDDVVYCKINDRLYEDDEAYNNRPKDYWASLFLTNSLDECCVCKEANTVNTNCGHNLCRLCFFKCQNKQYCEYCDTEEQCVLCPMCRKLLKNDCMSCV